MAYQFKDRREAGQKLAEALSECQGRKVGKTSRYL